MFLAYSKYSDGEIKNNRFDKKRRNSKTKEQELNKTLGKDNFYFYTYEHVDFIDNKNKNLLFIEIIEVFI